MSSLRHFIESSVTDLQKEIDAELFLWLSGKKSPGIAFSDSKRGVYWGPHLDDIVAKITNKAFETSRFYAEQYGVNPIDLAKDAGGVAESAVREVLDKMADHDRRMRGKGYPTSVAPKDTALELARSMRFVAARREAEVALFTEVMQKRQQAGELETKGSTVIITSARDTIISGDVRGGDNAAGNDNKQSSALQPTANVPEKPDQSIKKQIAVTVLVALLAGGTAPWWWNPLCGLFAENPAKAPVWSDPSWSYAQMHIDYAFSSGPRALYDKARANGASIYEAVLIVQKDNPDAIRQIEKYGKQRTLDYIQYRIRP